MSVGNDQKLQIQQATDIVRLIGEQISLQPKGKEFVGLCPFHNDKRPSLSVSPAKQIYKCFAGSAGGDVFSFVMNYHKMTFPETRKYLAERAGYLSKNPLPLKDDLLKLNQRKTEWTFIQLAAPIRSLVDRNFEVGKSVFKVSNCVACHRLNNEGQVFGPDLAKLDPKKRTAEHILRSLLEPSKDVDEKYQTYALVQRTGKVVTGMVLEETDRQVKVIVNPLAKSAPAVVDKSSIVARRKLPNSIMPEGLLNRLSREEILDLIAYVLSGGDMKSKLFKAHKH